MVLGWGHGTLYEPSTASCLQGASRTYYFVQHTNRENNLYHTVYTYILSYLIKTCLVLFKLLSFIFYYI